MSKSTSARLAAVWMLDEVLVHHKTLSELRGHGPVAALPATEQARAIRLATDVLRWLPRADALWQAHVSRTPAPRTCNILRLGAYELALGGAPYGVIDSLVALASSHKRSAPQKGLINAVLRKIAVDTPAKWAALPIPRLPGWLRRPLRDAYGERAVAAFERAHSQPPPLDLTPKDGDAEGLARRLEAAALPTGTVRIKQSVQVSALTGFAEGDWWVQDAAAAIPVKMARPQEGQRALDLCAAPGGKTLQLAAAGADVTAVDISEARMARLRENLDRTGLRADLRIEDARAIDGSWPLVVLDAPCSASGTIRRHPDLPHVRAGRELGPLTRLQADLIDHALRCLEPGGRLVYCTCSLLPAEGEDQIRAALSRHPRLRVDAQSATVSGAEHAWRDALGGLRLRPDYWDKQGGMDGFYVAALTTAD